MHHSCHCRLECVVRNFAEAEDSRIHSEAEGVPATPIGPGPDQCFITDSNVIFSRPGSCFSHADYSDACIQIQTQELAK